MTRTGLLLLACSTAHALLAQWPTLPQDSLVDLPGRWQHDISAAAWLDVNANTLRNDLVAGLWQGGFLDRDLREASAMELNGANRGSYALGMRATWQGAPGLFGKAHWRPLVSLAHHDVLGLRFADDLYKVAFFGNAQFEGTTAKLGPTHYEAQRYQTLGFGISDARTGSFLRLDAVKGQFFDAGDFRQADLFTGTDGLVLEADLDLAHWRSDTVGSGLERFNGAGVALSGRWARELRIAGRSATVVLDIHDLGFVQWNGHSLNLTKDTLIVYEGFDVVNIFDAGGNIPDGAELLDSLGLNSDRAAHMRLLPVHAALGIDVSLGEAWYGGLRVEQRRLPGHLPMASLGATRRLGTRTLLGATVAYGGAGGLRAGLAMRTRIGGRSWLEVSTPHLPGFLLGGTHGLGLMAALRVGL